MIAYPNQYKKITIVCYPYGAGGNFLINCLTLSDDAVFRSSALAQQQLNGQFSYNDKLNYLLEKLATAKNSTVWNDLELGCEDFYGVENETYSVQYHEVIAHRMNRVVYNTIDHDKHMFLVAHTKFQLRAYQNFWPNASLILFTDFAEFLNKRPQLNRTPVDDLFLQLHGADLSSIYSEQICPAVKFPVATAYKNPDNFLDCYYYIADFLDITATNGSDLVMLFNKWQTAMSYASLK